MRAQLSGWGRLPVSTAEVSAPGSTADLIRLAGEATARPWLARGFGRSYGDAPLNEGGRVFLTGSLNRVLHFDAATGEVDCEPGVSLRQLIDAYLPSGWMVPVTPGTSFVSIGGAIANDVHGKNHDVDGSFCDHVVSLDLLLPSGQVQTVTPASGDLWQGTVGGIGLTGAIVRARLKLARVTGDSVRVSERRIRHLDEFLERFLAVRTQARFSVGWIDSLARGANLGRGVLETADYVDSTAGGRFREPLNVPCDMPPIVLSPWAVRAFNALYWRRIPQSGRERVVPLRKFLYPLDMLGNWNRLYGRRGFRQLQIALPEAIAPKLLPQFLERIARGGCASFLSVIKTMGRAGQGYLSFPMPGVTLALDLPNRPGLETLLHSLHGAVADAGGHVYLAKDSCVSREHFDAMYPLAGRMRALRERLDPEGRIRSDMAARLGMAKPPGAP
jgi:decaprenylphospho-beta-D-ribofuranose 2-oxidase